MAGSMSMPYFRVAEPKEKRVTPVTASMPTQAISRPIMPEIRLLGRLLPDTPAIRLMPMMPSEKYSTEVKFATSLVIREAQSSSNTAENRPPNTEANSEVSSAFFTLPFLASG